jgi:ribonuclease HI
MAEKLPEVAVYTDGGCRPNPGPGGWGAVILPADGEQRELSGGEVQTTNNRMELTAAVEALGALEAPHRVTLVTDSTYLKNGITSWLDAWRRKGWRTADGKEVLNRDLWESLSAQVARHRVEWQWTKGHAGDRWNERADRLASAAIPSPPLPLDDESAVHLFAAAAYSGKSGVGGWALLLCFQDQQKRLSGRVEGTSANRMQLEAVARGLEALTRPARVHVYTTSDYVKDGATTWIRGWRERGWRTRDGSPVRHRDLWQRIGRQTARHRTEWHVVDRSDRPPAMEEAKTEARAAIA